VHARGIELHDAVRIRQAAVADAVVERIELHDVDSRDESVEHIRTLRDQGPRFFDARHVAAILESIAVR